MIITKKKLLREFIDEFDSVIDGDDKSETTSQINVGTQTTDGYVSQARQRMEYPFNFGGTAYSRGATLQGFELGDYTGTDVNDGKGINIDSVTEDDLFNNTAYDNLDYDVEVDDDDELDMVNTENNDESEAESESESENGFGTDNEFDSLNDLKALIQDRVNKALEDTENETDTRKFGSKIHQKSTISQQMGVEF